MSAKDPAQLPAHWETASILAKAGSWTALASARPTMSRWLERSCAAGWSNAIESALTDLGPVGQLIR